MKKLLGFPPLCLSRDEALCRHADWTENLLGGVHQPIQQPQCLGYFQAGYTPCDKRSGVQRVGGAERQVSIPPQSSGTSSKQRAPRAPGH